MSSFKAYLISEVDGKTQSAFVSLDEAQLDAGEVTIKVAYSSVNYKDALAATGAGRIIRRYPCVGGVDLCGIVTHSGDARFKAGDAVIATSFDIGVAHHGGYAELALGTAGFTAALAIVRMEENGLRPSAGPVVVSGATGGVGGLAVDMLSGLGYRVTALTGKEAEFDYLKRLGAREVMYRSALDLTRIRPLDKALWAGAVDNLGGDVLAWMASTMKPAGTIASIGLAAGTALNTTVMPFILRGVSLLGVDSVNAGEPYRRGIWQRLASDLKPRHLLEMTHSVAFDDLPGVFDSFLKGKSRGRVVVELAGETGAAH